MSGTDPIVATVEPASPVPPRPPAPTFYALRMWMDVPKRWWVGYESPTRSFVEMMQTKHPGSSLVIIPGEAP